MSWFFDNSFDDSFDSDLRMPSPFDLNHNGKLDFFEYMILQDMERGIWRESKTDVDGDDWDDDDDWDA